MKKAPEFLVMILFVLSAVCCRKFLAEGKQSNALTSNEVFSSDQSANAVAVNIYYDVMKVSHFLNGYISKFMGQYADELQRPGQEPLEADAPYFYCNVLPADKISLSFWNMGYNYIYQCNNILENLKDNRLISDSVNTRLTGEAKFLRSLNYFYLVNLFGDIPEITGTDYRKNNKKPRQYKEVIWQLLIRDLTDAENLLPVFTPDGDSSLLSGIRANKWAAKALLARVYLYQRNWDKAEQYASEVIEKGNYRLEENLDKVFLPDSKEVIFQIAPVKAGTNSAEATYFIPIGNTHPNFVVRQELLNSFETGDRRKKQWLGSYTIGNKTYYYPYKYKIRSSSLPAKEYNVLMRLSEMYLIRAEARTRQGKLYGAGSAASDLTQIRSRTNLPPVAPALTQQQMLLRVEQERRIELFSEWGHRWFDLKRNEAVNHPGQTRAEEIIGGLKPGFKSHQLLLPVPQSERLRNPNLEQTAGY